MWPIFISMIFTSIQVKSLLCGGDITSHNEISHRGRNLADYTRDPTISPIRLLFYYNDSLTLGSVSEDTQFKSIIIKAVNNFYSKALFVRRLKYNLQIQSTYCTSYVKVPSSHNTIGIPNTDLVIYVQIVNDPVGYVATAGSCESQNTDRENVVAGTMLISKSLYLSQTVQGRLTTVMHEMVHILGFSSTLYPKFRNSVGSLYSVTKIVSIRGVNKYIFTGPNALSKAKVAFNCSTIEGIELEEKDMTYAASHWDRRIMANDFMISYVVQDPIVSTVTLGLLQDSGWYYPDYSMATVPIFGRNAGCNYFNNKCLSNSVPDGSNLWCNISTSWTCDLFSTNKASCAIVTYSSSFPSYFQYFSSSNMGGYDAFADYCPYRKANTNGSCRGNGIITYTTSYANEVIGPNSRCFESTLALSPQSFSSGYAACYEVKECNSTGATVIVGTEKVFCPFTGGKLPVKGYNGFLNCPSSSVLCGEVPCINMCYGQGKCINGTCQCFSGYGGSDCSIVCSSGCIKCDAVGCTQCNSALTLINYLCLTCPLNCLTCTGTTCLTCATGFYLSLGSCLQCPNTCSSCSSQISCTACIKNYQVVSGQCLFACSSNCLDCTSSTSCQTCTVGSYLLSGSCTLCPTSCSECTSTACTICKTGYLLASGSCIIVCPINCFQCSSTTVCSVCNVGYYLSSGTCSLCPKLCSACSSATVCTVCVSGYKISSNNCVLICPIYCQACSDSITCTVCLDGYFVSNGFCGVCLSPCTKCSGLSDCSACLAGYQVVNKACVLIVCSANCKKCVSSSVCTECNVGYFINSSSSCSPVCISNCLSCTNNLCCAVCMDRFYLNSSGLCDSCSSPCLRCKSASSCIDCLPGYSLVNTSCL